MIKKVTKEYINEVIENRGEHIGEKVFYYDSPVYVACDNSTGDAWTEEFFNEEETIKWLDDSITDYRICSECGQVMIKGYCIEQGLQYFCSDSCLYENYTKEEFEEMYNDGEGDTYYTEWSE